VSFWYRRDFLAFLARVIGLYDRVTVNKKSAKDLPRETGVRGGSFSDGIGGLASWKLAVAGGLLLWCAQPPLRLWPLAWVALLPWLGIVYRPRLTRRDYAVFFLAATTYWAVTMQGIRHAHPAMYVAWIALAAYLASYAAAWLWLCRVVIQSRNTPNQTSARLGFRMPGWVAVPIIWTGLECVRNYFLTGVSAVMLGHTQADVPAVIQIADTLGSYGVSFLVSLVNAALADFWFSNRRDDPKDAGDGHRTSVSPQGIGRFTGLAVAGVAALATIGYGLWRLQQAARPARSSATTIALVGRDEPIDFEQASGRELEIFDAYFRQSLEAARMAAERGVALDAVVWPESMFTGSLPWLVAEPDRPLVVPPGSPLGEPELRDIIAENRNHFEHRARQVQFALRQITGQSEGPELVVGCSVVRYDAPAGGHSGCVHIGGDGKVARWYAKNHLVMFGEYIPLIDYLPWIDRFIPPGMGILPGEGAVALAVGDLVVSPNVCIETAVERVTVGHVRDLIGRGSAPDVVVNVTNDGWFDRSSIVEHHLRCAQMVAVASRRPILIAANGGPTAWIDGSGRVVQRLPSDAGGVILVAAVPDGRNAPHLWVGDWPARVIALMCGWWAVAGLVGNRRENRHRKHQAADSLSP
jgi:apolipoprotein N-acyltransferase